MQATERLRQCIAVARGGLSGAISAACEAAREAEDVRAVALRHFAQDIEAARILLDTNTPAELRREWDRAELQGQQTGKIPRAHCCRCPICAAAWPLPGDVFPTRWGLVD